MPKCGLIIIWITFSPSLQWCNEVHICTSLEEKCCEPSSTVLVFISEWEENSASQHKRHWVWERLALSFHSNIIFAVTQCNFLASLESTKLLPRNPAPPRLVQNEDKNKQPTGTSTSAHSKWHKGMVHVERAAQQCHFQLQLRLQTVRDSTKPSHPS